MAMTVAGPGPAASWRRARAGDEDAFGELTAPHRRELQLHCYRIVGSVPDAEDLVQETLLAAWRGFAAFESRSSLRAWLYRIATNRCLNALRDRARRPRELQPVVGAHEPLRLDPYPDVLLEGIPDGAPGPDARYETREAVELAFVGDLQRLPPRQRVALVLRDVLGFRITDVAEMLDTSETVVKGALQRARASLGRRSTADRERAPRASSARERELVGRFADAVEAGDIDSVVALLTDDALLTMPPQPLEYRGDEAIGGFLRHRADLRGASLRVVTTRANGQPAFGCYLPDPLTAVARPYGMIVVTLAGDAITTITWFSDTGGFRRFGLPASLPSP